MRNILFDQARQKQLLEKGYTICPFISGEQVADILDRLLQLSPDDKFSPEGNDKYAGTTIHSTFLDTNIEYKRKADGLIRDAFSSQIEELLDNYRVLTGNFFVKPPGRGNLPIHQNWSFLQNPNDITITIWCPLVDVDKENGTIQLIEGSHKVTQNIVTPTCLPVFSDYEDTLVKNYSKPISLKAGECLIFDDRIIHWSGDNKTTAPRYVVQILCVPAEARTVFYYLDPTAPEKGFEMLEVGVDFFIEQKITDLISGHSKPRSLGFIENKNISLTEEDFIYALKNEETIGLRDHISEGTAKTGGNVSLLHRIKSFFKSNAE